MATHSSSLGLDLLQTEQFFPSQTDHSLSLFERSLSFLLSPTCTPLSPNESLSDYSIDSEQSIQSVSSSPLHGFDSPLAFVSASNICHLRDSISPAALPLQDNSGTPCPILDIDSCLSSANQLTDIKIRSSSSNNDKNNNNLNNNGNSVNGISNNISSNSTANSGSHHSAPSTVLSVLSGKPSESSATPRVTGIDFAKSSSSSSSLVSPVLSSSSAASSALHTAAELHQLEQQQLLLSQLAGSNQLALLQSFLAPQNDVVNVAAAVAAATAPYSSMGLNSIDSSALATVYIASLYNAALTAGLAAQHQQQQQQQQQQQKLLSVLDKTLGSGGLASILAKKPAATTKPMPSLPPIADKAKLIVTGPKLISPKSAVLGSNTAATASNPLSVTTPTPHALEPLKPTSARTLAPMDVCQMKSETVKSETVNTEPSFLMPALSPRPPLEVREIRPAVKMEEPGAHANVLLPTGHAAATAAAMAVAAAATSDTPVDPVRVASIAAAAAGAVPGSNLTPILPLPQSALGVRSRLSSQDEDEHEGDRRRKLARKAELARNSRRQKKERLEELEFEVAQLKKELAKAEAESSQKRQKVVASTQTSPDFAPVFPIQPFFNQVNLGPSYTSPRLHAIHHSPLKKFNNSCASMTDAAHVEKLVHSVTSSVQTRDVLASLLKLLSDEPTQRSAYVPSL